MSRTCDVRFVYFMFIDFVSVFVDGSSQQRLSDLIGPYRGTYRIVYSL